MYKNQSVLALIPARGGSKGILRKNLRKVGDHSLVGWSCKHAMESQYIDRCIVSSDDMEIINEAKHYNAETPFIRPLSLAQDHILDLPVFEHALTWLKTNENWRPEIVVHLRPTTPYRQAVWIDQMIEILVTRPCADAIRSVSLVSQHPYRVNEIDEEGYLVPIMKHRHPNPSLLRRQDHPPMYFYNCVIDVSYTRTIIDKKSMTGSKLLPWVMPQDDVIDIDSKSDLDFARYFFSQKSS
jgi:CMP-N,N'-diacetyllegionaminic acid synthase